MATTKPKVIGPTDGKQVDLGSIGVRFMLWDEESGGGVSLVEHPMPPRALAAPLHRHSREDEYSYVLEGRMGAQLGDEIVFAEQGDFVFKPRDQWHTFWNAGDEPARILELIAPGGFEHFFERLGENPIGSGDGPPDLEGLAGLGAEYGLEFDFESVPGLIAEHGLRFPGVPE